MKDDRKNISNFPEILSQWLSFKGRVNQKEFWLYHVLPFVILYVSLIPLSNLFAIWILLAGTVKRLHDSNSSGKRLIPFGILSVVLFAISMAVLFISFLGGMTGNVSANEFEDQLIILGLPVLVLLLLPIYAGLKPSSPDENKYGSPPPPLVLGTGYKIALVSSIIVSLASVVFLGIGGLSFSDTDNSWKADDPDDPELIRVVKDRDFKGLQTLLENGEDPNQISVQGSTALMIALSDDAVYKKASILLLEYGANPNINSKFENSSDIKHTPLVIAVGKSFPSAEFVELLLEKGANINPPKANYEEDSPLMAVIKNKPYSDESIAVVELLLTHGADPNLVENETAIHMMLKKGGRVEIIKLLLDHGSNLSVPSNQLAFEYALKYTSVDMLRLFLEHDISPEQITMAKKWVDKKLRQLNGPNDIENRNRWLQKQRLLINVKKNNER